MGFAGRESARVTLLNRTTDAPIATRVELAVTRRARRRGLLGRARLAPGAALVLVPCVAVHTAFMRFPIDVVFVNRQGMAIRAVPRLRPWRVAMASGAYAVIELSAGALARRDLKVGDRVCLVRTDRPGATQQLELAQVDEWLNARAS